MRLKRLIVQGFKSFADKTVFDFDANLTGIVGPNGCGKSNVVDAMKWVLGDQRAKSLRGDEMTDVIFKGAEGREALEQAEVSIVLEEADRHEDGVEHRREVVVGRRLNREKESHYLLDGEIVRLKDVRDRLMDTGLGVGAYSVMEQGRIDAVLSADPESRRAIFEEAAGISRFKIQKRESLRKLERTEQNLARVKDLLDERERRIRSLKIQAGKARRWRELKDELRDQRSAVTVVDAGRIRVEQQAAEERLGALEDAFSNAVTELESARGGLGEVEARIRDGERALAEAQDRVRESSSRLESTQHRVLAAQQRARELDGDAETSAARAGTLRQQQVERQDALAQSRQALIDVEAKLVELGKEAELRRAAVSAARERVREIETARESRRAELLDLLHERTRHRNQAHDEKATLRGLAARKLRLGERKGAIDVELGARAVELADVGRVIEDLEQRMTWLEGEESRVVAEVGSADQQAGELARREAELREKLASTGSRLEVLEGMEEHLEGFDAGARHLLEIRPEGLRGRLLDFIEADLEHSRALQSALGGAAQALVVESRAHAEAMLELLARENKGRATLLVAKEFGDRLVHASLFTLPAGTDYLYKRVRCKAEAWPMVQWLLRGVCLIDDLTQADPRRTDLCFVTLDGRILCGPKLEGGSSEEEMLGGLVVRRARIRALREEVDGLREALAALSADRGRAQERAQELLRRAREIGDARATVRDRVQHASSDRLRLAERFTALERERDGVVAEFDDVERHRLGAWLRLGDLILGELLIQRREVSATAAEAEAARRLEDARAQATEAASLEHENEVERATAKSSREAEVQRIASLDATLRDLQHAIDELEDRRESAREGAEKARAEAERLGAELEVLAELIAEREAARSEAQERLSSAREDRQAGQDAVRRCEANRENLREDIGRCRGSRGDLDHRFARLEDRLRDETGVELGRLLGEIEGFGLVDVELAGPPAPVGTVDVLEGPVLPVASVAPEVGMRRLWVGAEFDVEAARREVQVIEAQIERLGAVNVDAVRELEEEERKLGTLEQDYADLTEARKSLMEALRRMETESRALFGQTFEAARENFRQIFRKLFQGGRADMYLVEGEDALEAGIEIVAKPPGKELQSIALLSGGERSLTALAILFAVFKVKPSPFCILDEVDAALDETNVERFLRVLGDFVGPSQFCVVTHHKRTMAECDLLYGITMQKRGVSTRISVALDEVDELTEAPGFEKAQKQRIAGEEAIGF
ncbi:MAG: chromosome segregation protein SMC [Planctomycetota bacterium]